MLSKKMYIIFSLCIIFGTLISSFITLEKATAIDPDQLREISTSKPIVYVDCPEVANLDEIIIVHVKVFNLNPTYIGQESYGDLYGLDIQFTWDPIILEYINHTVKIPVETYPDGVLHRPVMEIENTMDPESGTYTLIYASRAPAKPFNNPNASNTIFSITFKVRYHGGTDLKLKRVKLANILGRPIYREVLDGTFRTPTAPIARFYTIPESYPVINKRIEFNASISYDPDGKIIEYLWDFGDGNETRTSNPIISHEYKSVAIYNVKLRVVDNSGLSSPTFSKSLQVVQKRNLAVKDIGIPSLVIYYGEQITINVTVENNGDAPENFKVSLSYNTTANGNWTLIEEKEMNLPKGTKCTLKFIWDTSVISEEVAALNCSLFLLANITMVPHEENIMDNILKSTYPIRMLFMEFHDIAVSNLSIKAVSNVGKEFAPPLIKGERIKVFFKIQVKGNMDENYSISANIFTSNGVIILFNLWEEEFLEKNMERDYSYTFNEPISISGNYTITVNVTLKGRADERPIDNYIEKTFLVIEQPKIEIIAPKTVYIGEEVSFRVKVSDVKTPIWYKWTRIKPGEENEINRREKKDIIYIFKTPGNWTVKLTIIDGFGITFDVEREATAAYKAETMITVLEKTGVLTLEGWTIAVGLIIVAIVFIAVFVYLKLRRS